MASILNIDMTAEPRTYIIQSDEETIAMAKELAVELVNSLRHP